MGFTGIKKTKEQNEKDVVPSTWLWVADEGKAMGFGQYSGAETEAQNKQNSPIHNASTPMAEHSAAEVVLPDFLKPKKDVNTSALNDLFKIETNKKTTFQITLKTLNALAIVAPIINGLMNNPGVNSSNEQLSAGFKLLIQKTSTLSDRVCKKLSVDPENENNYWIRNVLEKHFSTLIRDQWVIGRDLDLDKMDGFIDNILKNIDQYKGKVQYEEYSEMMQVRVGLLKASTKILNTIQSTFDLYRDTEKDIEDIMDKIYVLSTDTVRRLSDEYASPKERAKLFYSIIIQAANTYSVAWEMETKRVTEIINNTPKEKIEKLLTRYKEGGGMPIEKIEHDFNKYFNKTIAVTERLIFSQRGTLERRLKSK